MRDYRCAFATQKAGRVDPDGWTRFREAASSAEPQRRQPPAANAQGAPSAASRVHPGQPDYDRASLARNMAGNGRGRREEDTDGDPGLVGGLFNGADEALVRVLRLLNQPHAQGAVVAGVGSLRPSPKAAAHALLDLRHIEPGR